MQKDGETEDELKPGAPNDFWVKIELVAPIKLVLRINYANFYKGLLSKYFFNRKTSDAIFFFLLPHEEYRAFR